MKLPRRTLVLVIGDVAIVLFSLIVAYMIRFDGDLSKVDNGTKAFMVTPLLYVFSYLLMRVYRINWRYAGLRDAFYLGVACLLGLVLSLMMRLTGNFSGYPYSVAVIQAMLILFGTYAMRAAVRVWDFNAHRTSYSFNDPSADKPARRVLIVGAGDAGEMMARDFGRFPGYEVVGFVDDDPEKHGLTVHRYKVHGDCDSIPAVVDYYQVDDILLAIPSASGDDVRRILNICNRTKAIVRILPGLPQVLQQSGALPMLREVQIEDLLRREPVEIDRTGIRAYVQNERVLITGGGGSIGGELCRQIAAMNPAELILVGHGENSIFEIQQELRNSHHELNISCYIASIKQRIDSILFSIMRILQ